ncbi:MAG: hypothetical protein LUC22_02960, partial [Prevotella sp.]|nr:hypothetical protein [Prevotella sp.]
MDMNANVTAKDRINEFIRAKRLKKKDFESRCGLNPGYLSTMRKGFGGVNLQKVLDAFPDLNRDWLLYGEGTMLKAESNASVAAVNNGTIHQEGDGNRAVTVGDVNEALLAEISEQRKITQGAQDITRTAQAQLT